MRQMIVVAAFVFSFPASAQESPSQVLLKQWNGLGSKVIAMAEDWPEDKYGYRPNKDVRTFGEVVVHIAASNYFFINSATGKSTKDFQDDPKGYTTKKQILAYLKKSVADGAAGLEAGGDAGAVKNLKWWLGLMEHAGEHYGNLVTYYRINGVVPPQSRPKPKAELEWIQDDYELARTEAQKRHVPILAEVWAPW